MLTMLNYLKNQHTTHKSKKAVLLLHPRSILLAFRKGKLSSNEQSNNQKQSYKLPHAYCKIKGAFVFLPLIYIANVIVPLFSLTLWFYPCCSQVNAILSQANAILPLVNSQNRGKIELTYE